MRNIDLSLKLCLEFIYTSWQTVTHLHHCRTDRHRGHRQLPHSGQPTQGGNVRRALLQGSRGTVQSGPQKLTSKRFDELFINKISFILFFYFSFFISFALLASILQFIDTYNLNLLFHFMQHKPCNKEKHYIWVRSKSSRFYFFLCKKLCF